MKSICQNLGAGREWEVLSLQASNIMHVFSKEVELWVELRNLKLVLKAIIFRFKNSIILFLRIGANNVLSTEACINILYFMFLRFCSLVIFNLYSKVFVASCIRLRFIFLAGWNILMKFCVLPVYQDICTCEWYIQSQFVFTLYRFSDHPFFCTTYFIENFLYVLCRDGQHYLENQLLLMMILKLMTGFHVLSFFMDHVYSCIYCRQVIA